MDRILRAAPGWQDAVADALRRAPRPIPLDERLLPRTLDGEVRRRTLDRASFPPARAAATLLVLYPAAAGLAVPLTVRHGGLRAHAGEVSLPGGAVDATDRSVEDAALREAWEEIGLPIDAPRIVGQLDEVWIPVSNFALRPVVATLDAPPALVPHDAEVTAIVELPLTALFDPTVMEVEEFGTSERRVRAGAYRYDGVRIWGATALTLGMLATVLEGGAVSDESAPSS